MSMSGQRRLELERERLEQIRLAQVQAECNALIATCDAALRGVRDVAVQQFAAQELQQVAAGLAAERRELAAQPDASLDRLTALQSQLHTAIARGEARARAWSEEQARLVGEARAEAERATAVATTTAPSTRALELAEAGRLAEARDALAAAASATSSARGAIVDEQVRREVVRGLLRSLQEMGFVAVGPRLDDGVVTLEGRLVSGRRAVFEVRLDGELHFDLDGYEGRACADDLTRVETILRDRFGVKLGPAQIVWKNPDRLSQGALRGPDPTSRKKA
mgnify:CR=1 FL=1